MTKEFVLLVKELRESQKKFFTTRDSTYLKKSKALEKKVDEELKKILGNEPSTNQQHLFL